MSAVSAPLPIGGALNGLGGGDGSHFRLKISWKTKQRTRLLCKLA